MEKQLYEIIDWSRNYRVLDSGDLMSMTLQSHPSNQYEIITTGCDLPSSSYGRNDIIVRDINDKQIVFTRMAFMRRVQKFCECCGQRKPYRG